MKARQQRILKYLKGRLKEASTWRGVVLLLTSAGVYLSDEQKELISVMGLFFAGLIGAAAPDKSGDSDDTNAGDEPSDQNSRIL